LAATASTIHLSAPVCSSTAVRTVMRATGSARNRSASDQGLTLVHVRAQLEQLQDTVMS
jgi:hypothetical protein